MTVTAVVTVVKVVSSGIPLEKTKLAVIATLEIGLIEYGIRISKRRQFVTMHKGNSMNPLLKVIQF